MIVIYAVVGYLLGLILTSEQKGGYGLIRKVVEYSRDVWKRSGPPEIPTSTTNAQRDHLKRLNRLRFKERQNNV